MQGPLFLFAPLFFLLFVVALSLGLALIILSFRARRRVTHPECGSCGYAVEGLEVLRCPECGSDLRSVGIVTPRMNRGLSPRLAAILLALTWTLLLPLPASIATQFAGRAIPYQYDNTVMAKLGPGPSASFTGVDLLFTGKGSSPGSGYDSAQAFLIRTDGSKSRPFVVDLVEQTCTFIHPETGMEGPVRPLNSTIVEDWMKAEDAYRDATLARMQAMETIAMIASIPTTHGARTRGGFTSVNLSTTSVFRRVAWFMPTALAVWGLVWLGGLLFIYRRYRRRVKASSRPAA